MIQDLSPPELEVTTIEGVLHGLARLFDSRYRFKVSVRVAGTTGEVSEDLLSVTDHVVRELLFNADNQSRTDRADVIVDHFAEHLHIAVVDHGVGFDATRRTSVLGAGFGLLHLLEQSRATVLWMNSADDFVNPAELGIAEAASKRLRHGRFVLIPTSARARGHGTHKLAAIW